MDNFGLSFSPTNQDQRMGSGPGGSQGAAGGASNPIQNAIRTLSYKIPRTSGAGAGIAPQSLLQAQGAAGLAMPTMSTPPSAVGPQSGAGAALGDSQGGSGGSNPVMAGLEQWLRMLFAQQGQNAPMGATMGSPSALGSAAPAPRIGVGLTADGSPDIATSPTVSVPGGGTVPLQGMAPKVDPFSDAKAWAIKTNGGPTYNK